MAVAETLRRVKVAHLGIAVRVMDGADLRTRIAKMGVRVHLGLALEVL